MTPARAAHGGAGSGSGVVATVVRAEDAPGPTLVVELDRLPRGALASRGELVALRRALAGTPYARLSKIALYGPSARPGSDLDYRFVQALPDGGFDFRTGCGHSLLACVVAAARPGPLTVHAVTTGDDVQCRPEGRTEARPDVPTPPPYTLRFPQAPDAPGTFPTGRPVDVLGGVPVSLVRYGNPYVFVDAAHLGIHSDDALFRAGNATLRRLLALRAHAARRLGHPPHSALPKIAMFTAGGGRTAVRSLTVGGWHPRLALTGAAALAAAAYAEGTVVPRLDGPVATPGGPVTVSCGAHHVAVHHKRATVLERLELPWRIHATA
ncbi:PrpF domain-containing protein [Streptomyces sp. NPDC093600]|uniref:PrpF domain-containing protein n=1 Tax=Streptomyces sp. NPDC093600 TaxID=3366047 RepID=UPI00380C76E3